VALSIVLGVGLACGGADVPAPAPLPDAAENADECKTFRGTAVPMDGGVVVSCSKKSVTLDHGIDARPLRWEYLEHYKRDGWSLADPMDGNPVAVRGQDKLVFLADGNQVTVQRSR